MRGILIDWLVEVALEFEFQDETLYLSVALVDQALSKFRVSCGSRDGAIHVAAVAVTLSAPTFLCF